MSIPDGIDPDDFTEAAVAASQEWERLTGFVPFLYEGSTETTRRYDPPGPKPVAALPARMGGGFRLNIPSAFLNVSEVRIGVTNDDEGELLVEGEDYDLEPVSPPFRRISFRRPIFGSPRSVSVKGKEGYCASLSALHAIAVKKLAGADILVRIQAGIAAGTVSWKEGDVEERSSIELVGALPDAWNSDAASVAQSVMRWQ
jgi:hypothetical protein